MQAMHTQSRRPAIENWACLFSKGSRLDFANTRKTESADEPARFDESSIHFARALQDPLTAASSRSGSTAIRRVYRSRTPLSTITKPQPTLLAATCVDTFGSETMPLLTGKPMKTYKKADFPVTKVRRFLEPGPVVLVSSAHAGGRDIMTMGWHMVMMDEPSMVGCFIWDQNYSRELVRKSKECVINIPTVDLVNAVIGIGNCHGPDPDKFTEFGLTAAVASTVDAPLIAECYANFECKLIDASLIKRYSLFVFEVVKAHVATSPRYPTTVHYRGDGVFMISGRNVSYRR